MNLNENTKVTLTIGQLKKLVREAKEVENLAYIDCNNDNDVIAKIDMTLPQFKRFAEKCRGRTDLSEYDIEYTVEEIARRKKGVIQTVLAFPTFLRPSHKKRAMTIAKKDPNGLYILYWTCYPYVHISWMSDNLNSLITSRPLTDIDDSDAKDDGQPTEDDYEEAVNELEKQLLYNEGAWDLRQDSGIERFREEVVYPTVAKFFDAGKTVDDLDEIADYVDGEVDVWSYYQDSDPSADA